MQNFRAHLEKTPPAQGMQHSPCWAPPGPEFVSWLEERLREDRQLLERRHEALLLELSGAGEVPPLPPLDLAPPAWGLHDQHQPTKPMPPRDDDTPRVEAVPANLVPQTPKPTPRDEDTPAASTDVQDSSATTPTVAATLKSSTTEMPRRLSSTSAEKRSSLRTSGDTYKGKSNFKSVILGTRFEVTFGVLIVLNAVIMALEVQYYGLVRGSVDGVKQHGFAGWTGAHLVFQFFEWCFGTLFTLELILKLVALRRKFIRDLWNVFDSVIVGFWLVSSFGTFFELPLNPMVLRVCRLVRLLRLVRLAKMSTMFDVLVLMISSVQASAAVLLWGMVLLTLFMTIGAFLLTSLLEDAMDPEISSLSSDVRDEFHRLFGTYTRCMITMFEVTMASWVSTCRLLVDNMGEGYAVFFIVYKCVVGFAVLKVITGVFLHETFRCASLDDDLMIQNRRRMRTKFKNKMITFFEEADDHGDGGGNGEVSCEEFVEMIENDRVNTWLEAMDLRIRDVGAERIFAFLAGPDMSLTRDELCSGMSRLRGAAQGLDVVTLLEIATPEMKMPPSKDVLRFTGGIKQVSPQTTAGASVSAAATEIRQAASEVLAVTADLRSALGGGATATHGVGSLFDMSAGAAGAFVEPECVEQYATV